MKNVIYSYYNIMVYNIYNIDNNYYFYYNDEMYLLCLVLGDTNIVKEVYDIIIRNKINCFKIISNVHNDFFVKVENNNYVLLKVNGILKYEYSIFDFKYIILNKNGYNWGKLWGDRLDYYEIQLRELGLKYQNLLNSFGLYKGIAENAILYYNLTMNKYNDRLDVGLVHNRIKYPCYLLNYENPVNYVVDYNVRDVAEYIKSYTLSDSYDFLYITKILDHYKFNKKSFNLLYSRILYPCFYFDIFDNIILEDANDDDISGVLDNYNKYINMLKEIYLKYKDKYEMFKIEWLDKIKM